MTTYTLEYSTADSSYIHLVDERGIIVFGSYILTELIEHLDTGDTIVKGESVPVTPMDDGHSDDDYNDVGFDRELEAMEAQAEYSERQRWY